MSANAMLLPTSEPMFVVATSSTKSRATRVPTTEIGTTTTSSTRTRRSHSG